MSRAPFPAPTRAIARALIAAAIAGLTLGACSSEEEKLEQAATEAAEQEARFEPAERILNVEIGQTRNGYVISVVGLAPGVGYSAPELRPRREGKIGPDGFIDYDLVVQAPRGGADLGQGSAAARRVQMGLPVDAKVFKGASGIRVHAVTGGLQMAF